MPIGDYIFIGAAFVIGAVMALGIFIVIPVMLYFAVACTWEALAEVHQHRQRARRVEPAWVREWEADIQRQEAR